ncbi:MAG: hypothetical protein KA165_06430 [Saprospiraceae bacterium]|nr:hypothetical protein [Saprospiraceae bacterium]
MFGQSSVDVFMKGSAGNYLNRTFVLKSDKKVYENDREIAVQVEVMEKDFGYIDPTTGGEIEDEVLYIWKTGAVKPKMLLNENFETDYLKQNFDCSGVKIKLYGNKVFKDKNIILDNCQVLRCENGYTLAHQHDGQIKLYTGGSNWLAINQIITVEGISYYIKNADNSVWQLKGSASTATQIGSKGYLLQENDGQLIKIEPDYKYFRWVVKSWIPLQPKYVPVSPDMIDEGFWFFIQAKPLLNNVAVEDQKKGLCYNKQGALQMELIPETGNCDQYLWRTKKLSNGKRYLINKAKGGGTPLWLGDNGAPAFDAVNGSKEWEIAIADRKKTGTNGYQIKGGNGKALSYTNGSVTSKTYATGDLEQVWLFQFNQMVKDYFLPRPTSENLNANFLPADNANVQKLEWDGVSDKLKKLSMDEVRQLKTSIQNSYSEISQSYNKFLKGDNGVSFFATNTASDWVIVNYYFIINNMMNAVKSPKPSYSNVTVNDLSVLNGRSLTIIGKDDVSAAVEKQYFTKGFGKFYISRNRGGSGYRNPFQEGILVSEELACKTGIVNRPLDKSFRRFDHGVHEFGHALQELCNWVGIVKAEIAVPIDAAIVRENAKAAGDPTKKTPDQVRTEMLGTVRNTICYDCNENSSSPECICFMIQKWFNNSDNYEYYPAKRADNNEQKKVMEIIFGNENTWMPPKDIRKGGYNPSTFPLSPYFVDGEIYQIEGVGGFAGKYWTVMGVAPNDQLGFRALPANPTGADIKKTQFKVVALSQKPRMLVFESVSNPGYYLYPVRPAGKPWLVGLKNINPNDLKTDTDAHFILGDGVTGDPAHFSVPPRKNQAWVAGCGFPAGIGMHMPGAFGYTPEGHWKGAFKAIPKTE